MKNLSTIYKACQNTVALFDFALAYKISNDYNYEISYFTIKIAILNLLDALQTFWNRHKYVKFITDHSWKILIV